MALNHAMRVRVLPPELGNINDERTMAKPKNNERVFSVGFAVGVWFDLDIAASTPEEALEKAKQMRRSALITIENGDDSCNDATVEVVGVYDPKAISKVGL